MKDIKEFEIQLTPYNLKMCEIPLYKDTYLLLQLSISTFILSNKLLQMTLCKRALDIEIDMISLILKSYKSIENKPKYLKIINETRKRNIHC